MSRSRELMRLLVVEDSEPGTVGLVSAFTLGGFIHIALVIGLILVIVWAVTSFRARRI